MLCRMSFPISCSKSFIISFQISFQKWFQKSCPMSSPIPWSICPKFSESGKKVKPTIGLGEIFLWNMKCTEYGKLKHFAEWSFWSETIFVNKYVLPRCQIAQLHCWKVTKLQIHKEKTLHSCKSTNLQSCKSTKLQSWNVTKF